MSTTIDSETLAMLRDSMVRYQAGSYTFEQRRAWLEEPPFHSREAWQEYAALGWLALALPEDDGGFDGDPRALGAMMEFAGGALALEPLFASAVMGARILARCSEARAAAWKQSLAAGEQVFALAHAESAEEATPVEVRTRFADGTLNGAKIGVLHGDVADRFIVSARNAAGATVLCCVESTARGLSRTPYLLLDGRGAASLTLDSVSAEPLIFTEEASDVLERTLDEARLAMCSETLGAVRALNRITTEYLKTRHQFGRAIGTNQALQHRMVELYMLQEELAAVVEVAMRTITRSSETRERAVSAACAQAATTGRTTAHEAVQMHGGMGVTAELPVSHYFKRLMVTARLLGARDDHMARFQRATRAMQDAELAG